MLPVLLATLTVTRLASPTINWVSSPAPHGALVLVNGGNFGHNPTVKLTDNNGHVSMLKALDVNPSAVKFKLPPAPLGSTGDYAAYDIAACSSSTDCSNILPLNVPDVWCDLFFTVAVCGALRLPTAVCSSPFAQYRLQVVARRSRQRFSTRWVASCLWPQYRSSCSGARVGLRRTPFCSTRGYRPWRFRWCAGRASAAGRPCDPRARPICFEITTGTESWRSANTGNICRSKYHALQRTVPATILFGGGRVFG